MTHLPDCICDQRLDLFECRLCEREVPYCRGSDGDDLCDECWAETRRPTVEWTPEQQERLEAALSVAEEAGV